LEEGFGFIISSNNDAVLLYDLNNSHALIIQLSLNFLFVLCQCTAELLVLWILLNSTDGSNGASVSSDKIFESN
jgi:hypothetical protein